jgi:hypothetical protein
MTGSALQVSPRGTNEHKADKQAMPPVESLNFHTRLRSLLHTLTYDLNSATKMDHPHHGYLHLPLHPLLFPNGPGHQGTQSRLRDLPLRGNDPGHLALQFLSTTCLIRLISLEPPNRQRRPCTP